jgi:TonB family protein
MSNWTALAWPILVSAALKSTLVLGAAWAITILLRGRSAAARHVVWTASAAAVVALPLLSVSLPAVRLPLANAILPADTGGLVFRSTATGAAATGAVAAGAAQMAARVARGPAALTMNWRSALVLVWAIGLAVAMLQILVACVALWRARRAARPSDHAALAGSLARELGIDHDVRILEIPSGMPMTFGVMRPTVFVPACAAGWSEDRRRIVLLHELAHVRRGDAATHLMARAALALNWWNPLAWIAWRAFLHERERAADDLVLTSGAQAPTYAEHLLEIARTMQAQPATAAAGIPMARKSQLEGRLLAILDSSVQRTQPGRAAALAAAVLAIALAAPLAVIRAQSQAEQAKALQDVDTIIATANAQKNREMLDQAAISYEKLRKFDEARKLQEASLALTEQLSGAQSAEYAAALVKIGNLFRRIGAVDASNEFYNRALALGDRPEAFQALMKLGLTVKDPDKRREFLERAQVVGRNGNEVATAMTWLAREHESDADGPAKADSLYRGAIALAGPDSAEMALALEMYGQLLNTSGRGEEATPVLDRAGAIRKILVTNVGPKLAMDTAPMKVGTGVKAPSLLSKVEPQYSDEARSLKVAGTVLMKVVIDTDGLAKNIELVKGQGHGLDEKAAQAIALWKFKPGESGGAPVPVLALVEVNFRLM